MPLPATPSRALTEAAQSRLTMISGARDDCWGSFYSWMASMAVLRDPFSDPGPDDTVAFPSAASAAAAGGALAEDLEAVRELVEKRAKGAVTWVDLTRPGIDIPVVKVIVPGFDPPRKEA